MKIGACLSLTLFLSRQERKEARRRRMEACVSSPTPSRRETRAAKFSALSFSFGCDAFVPAYKYCISRKEEEQKNESPRRGDGGREKNGAGGGKKNCFLAVDNCDRDDADTAAARMRRMPRRFVKRDAAI